MIFNLFRQILKFAVRCHYSGFYIHGKENISRVNNYIIAPCHQQTVMDALVVLNISPKTPYFITRASAFKNKIIKGFSSLFRILPIYRERDGHKNLLKNNAVFLRCKNIIMKGNPLCIMAEGRHNNRHYLLSLGKGIFRIACDTQKDMGEQPLYIIPVGIDYSDYERPYSKVVVNIGEPMPVLHYMALYNENEALALNKMRKFLTISLGTLMQDIHSKTFYEEIYTISNIRTKNDLFVYKYRKTAWDHFRIRQKVSQEMDSIADENPDRFMNIVANTRKYKSLCNFLHLNEKLPSDHFSLSVTFSITIVLILFLVFCSIIPEIRNILLFLLLCFPIPLLPTQLIAKRIISDKQFISSVDFFIRYFISIIYIITIGMIVTINKGLWMNEYLNVGTWWGLIAMVVAQNEAVVAGRIINFLLDLIGSIYYWFLRLFRIEQMKELDFLIKIINE